MRRKNKGVNITFSLYPARRRPMLAPPRRQSLIPPPGHANRAPESRPAPAHVGATPPATPYPTVGPRQQGTPNPARRRPMLAPPRRQSLIPPSDHANRAPRIPLGACPCWRRPAGKALVHRRATPTGRALPPKGPSSRRACPVPEGSPLPGGPAPLPRRAPTGRQFCRPVQIEI